MIGVRGLTIVIGFDVRLVASDKEKLFAAKLASDEARCENLNALDLRT